MSTAVPLRDDYSVDELRPSGECGTRWGADPSADGIGSNIGWAKPGSGGSCWLDGPAGIVRLGHVDIELLQDLSAENASIVFPQLTSRLMFIASIYIEGIE